jgi:hypothetical protein
MSSEYERTIAKLLFEKMQKLSIEVKMSFLIY